MKKLIAALIGLPIALAATVGDDIIKLIARNGDDVARGVSGIARNGDDVARGVSGIARNGDDVARGVSGIAQSGDDVTRGVSGIAQSGDDVTRGVSGIAQSGDDVTRGVPEIAQPGDNVVVQVAPPPSVLNSQQAKAAVRNDVLQAISSGVNKNSTEELLAIARQANEEQSRQTGVLLSDAALLAIVYQAGAGTAAPREQ